MARLILATVACLYGTNYATVKVMEGVLEPSNLLALRFGLASLALLPALSGASFEVLLAGAEIGLYAILAYASQAWALRVRRCNVDIGRSRRGFFFAPKSPCRVRSFASSLVISRIFESVVKIKM